MSDGSLGVDGKSIQGDGLSEATSQSTIVAVEDKEMKEPVAEVLSHSCDIITPEPLSNSQAGISSSLLPSVTILPPFLHDTQMYSLWAFLPSPCGP